MKINNSLSLSYNYIYAENWYPGKCISLKAVGLETPVVVR